MLDFYLAESPSQLSRLMSVLQVENPELMVREVLSLDQAKRHFATKELDVAVMLDSPEVH
jgi:hypothetical protein